MLIVSIGSSVVTKVALCKEMMIIEEVIHGDRDMDGKSLNLFILI